MRRQLRLGRRLGAAVAAASAAWALSLWGVDAHAGPLADKALDFSRNYQDVHSPAFGCSVEVRFVSADDPTVESYHDQGDSTIWTGNYLAAESYRYAVTGDPEAKAFGMRALECLLAMEEVSGKPGFIARWVGPAEPPFLTGPCDGDCHVLTDGPYAGNYWIGNTSSDQYLGWWYGLSHAYTLLLDDSADEPVRQRIRDALARVIDTLRADNYLITDPDGTVSTAGPQIAGHEAIAFHLVAAEIAGGAYEDMLPDALGQQIVPYVFMTVYPITRWYQYYAFHLGHMAQHMILRHEKNPFWMIIHRGMLRDRLYAIVKDTQQVMFDYIALGEQAVPLDAQVLADDKAALLAFPQSPKRRVNPVQGPFEWDPVSDQLNGFFDWAREVLGIDLGGASRQALEPFPLEERCVKDFRWQRSPYEICGASDPAFEYAGMDYLIAYWLGRYHGFLAETD